MEIFLENDKLCSEETWKQRIEDLKKQVESSEKEPYETLKENLKQAILEAIKKRVPEEHYAVFLSGGVDSSAIALLCKKVNPDFTCYNVGFQDGDMEPAPDFVWAKKVADTLGLVLVSKNYNIEEAEDIVKEAIQILPKQEVNTDFVVKVGVASVVIAASKLANEKIFFSGLGSEEIFAGYKRHETEDINQECWNGLKKMWQRDLTRDCALAEYLNLDVRTPLLDPEVIIAAMRIGGEHKLKNGYKKAIFREIAEELGLPEEFAWRKKLGAQYGSRFDKALSKLGKKENINYKREYLLKITNGNN
jgi:asparagine synthetase B (glutamine-hydrolysing)